MASAEKGKFGEGMEFLRQAEKSLKTTLFKWRPDFEGAAMDYTNAATSFKNAKALPQCKDSLLKAADCYRQHHSLFSSAKSLEQAALVAKDMGDLEDTVRLIERACKLFQEHGSADTAALTLDKGAKIVEGKFPDKAANLYIRAAEVVQLEDRPRQAAEYFGKAARLMLKLKMYDEAAHTISREIEMDIAGENLPAAGRLAIALILVHLTRGDVVAAQKALSDGRNYIEDEELQTMDMLIEAFDQEDGDMAARALRNPFLKHMDVEYAKLARSLGKANPTSDSAGAGASTWNSDRQSSVASGDSSNSLADRASSSSRSASFDDASTKLGQLGVTDDSRTAAAASAIKSSDHSSSSDAGLTDGNGTSPVAKIDPDADDEYADGLKWEPNK